MNTLFSNSSALLSFFIGLCGVLFVDFRGVLEGGFFQGYSLVVLVVITLQVSSPRARIYRPLSEKVGGNF